MKILQVCGGPSWGGIEMQTVKIAIQLKAAGHDVLVFCSNGSHIHQKAMDAGLATESGLFDTKKSFLSSYRKAKKTISSFEPDIIHVQRSHDLSVVVAALRFTGNRTPLVFTRRMESRLKKTSLLHKWIYGRVNRAWGVSSFVRDNFLATSPMKPENVGVMNNGIDLSIFDPAKYDKTKMRAQFALPQDATIVGMTGRISNMKGHVDFVRAAAMLINSTKQNLHFVMAGGASVGEDAFAKEVYLLASELLPESSYTFVDQQPNLAGLLAAIDIFVFPSHRESFGNVLLEAMAMQLPIVSVDAGGVADMISCGENAICVQPQQPQEIFQSLLSLLDNKAMATNIAAAARKRSLDFSLENFLEKLVKEYEDVIH